MPSTGDLFLPPDVEAYTFARSLQYAASSTSESDTQEVRVGNKAGKESENIVTREFKSSDIDDTNSAFDNPKSPGTLTKQPVLKEAQKFQNIESDLLKERANLISKLKSFGIQSAPEVQDIKKIALDNDIDTDVDEIMQVKVKAKKSSNKNPFLKKTGK